ncbi:hypothetical protein [Kineosporia sp. NBRC 101731]|uniref:hypothetical protein n=1 Tax=Kineosporia sp. NBRC 101731 TaxID=3032199 RepID=UPI002554F15F|nr:hypothetical protein [Kineosporia sp. NBRC 101731]
MKSDIAHDALTISLAGLVISPSSSFLDRRKTTGGGPTLVVLLHHEYTATAVEILPWGVLAKTADGENILIDVTKGCEGLSVGDQVGVVILDDARRPFRGSCLAADVEIGRSLRRETEGDV